jgi:sugar phosphate isomerase/epimerase
MAAIHIGNQTAFSAASALEPFDYALANGFDAFEWFPDKKPSGGWDAEDLSPALREELRRTAQAKHIRFSVHGRWDANPLEPRSLNLLNNDIDLAIDLGAALFNIHLYPEHGIDVYIAAIKPIIQRTSRAGLQLSIENSPQNTPEHFNQLFKSLAKTGLSASHVGMCLDIGHANLCADTRNEYLKYLLALGKHVPVIHHHMHENWGDADTHLPLFTGPAGKDVAGLKKFLVAIQARKYSGSMILEGWPHPPTLLNQARDGLLQLLSPAHR